MTRAHGVALRDASVAAARAAAEYIRAQSRDLASLDVREKQAADFVSEVDTGAESRIVEVLHARVPGAVVVGEELSPDDAITGGTVFTRPLC